MTRIHITQQTSWRVLGERADNENARRLAVTAGCKPRMWGPGLMPKVPLAQNSFAAIPRAEWLQHIKMIGTDTLHNLCKPVLPPHNQGRTNFCWSHATVRAAEILRVRNGHSARRLSSASVAVPITGGRNVGGYPEKALMQLQSQGACTLELWPDSQLKKTPEATAFNTEARENRLIKWVDVQGWEMQISMLLRQIPVVLPLNWWGHAVCATDAVILDDGTIGIGFDNSWGADWGDYGWATLDEEKGTAEDGAFAPISEVYSL